jgi:hypothetical protein
MGNNTVQGDLRAQRNTAAEKFFKRKIKAAGSDGVSPFTGHKKVLIAGGGEAVVGSMPDGPATVGGCVGGLKDSGSYQGMKAGGR